MQGVIIQRNEKVTNENTEPKTYSVFISSENKIPYEPYGIGKKLKQDLANIFQKTPEIIEELIRKSIDFREKVCLGVYSKDLAETKADQANKSFNPRVSFVRIHFFAE